VTMEMTGPSVPHKLMSSMIQLLSDIYH